MSIFDWSTETISVEEAVTRGRQAEAMLASPVFREAMEEAEGAILDSWINGKDTAAREAAHAKLHGLKLFRDQLAAYAADAR